MIQSEFDNTESYVLTPGRYERDASDLGSNLALIRTFGRLGTFRQLNHRGTLAGAQAGQQNDRAAGCGDGSTSSGTRRCDTALSNLSLQSGTD